jgi:hypothetical protein
MKITGKLGDSPSTVDSGTVTLELTLDQAKVLCSLVGGVTGAPNTTYRGETDEIWRGLTSTFETNNISFRSNYFLGTIQAESK